MSTNGCRGTGLIDPPTKWTGATSKAGLACLGDRASSSKSHLQREKKQQRVEQQAEVSEKTPLLSLACSRSKNQTQTWGRDPGPQAIRQRRM